MATYTKRVLKRIQGTDPEPITREWCQRPPMLTLGQQEGRYSIDGLLWIQVVEILNALIASTHPEAHRIAVELAEAVDREVGDYPY